MLISRIYPQLFYISTTCLQNYENFSYKRFRWSTDPAELNNQFIYSHAALRLVSSPTVELYEPTSFFITEKKFEYPFMYTNETAG